MRTKKYIYIYPIIYVYMKYIIIGAICEAQRKWQRSVEVTGSSDGLLQSFKNMVCEEVGGGRQLVPSVAK